MKWGSGSAGHFAPRNDESRDPGTVAVFPVRFQACLAYRGRTADAGSTRLRQFPVFRRLQIHPGYRVDPTQMVVDLLHSGDVLRGDNGGLSRTLLGDDAAQMDDAVAHHDAQAERTPAVLRESVD